MTKDTKERVQEERKPVDPDADEHISFGHVVAALATMLFSHFILYYLFMSLYMYDGALFVPWYDINKHWKFAEENFVPTKETWTVYLAYILMEAVFAYILPGFIVKGLPIPSNGGKQLTYNCNGFASWWCTKAVVIALHYFEILPFTWIAANIMPLITTMIVFSDILSIFVYVVPFFIGTTMRMTGSHIYDFFMGSSLNPRLGSLDIKMWAETRVSWITLFLLTFSAAMEQYRQLGTVTPPMIFMCATHWLYSNACHKGEEMITTTWDIFHEKYGWMLCYWNLAGVPLMYCWNSFYILKNPHAVGPVWIGVMFTTLLVTYYFWDTTNSQKNAFRMMERGTYKERSALICPKMPYKYVKFETAKYIKTKHGNKILIDGWYKYARKLHYTCDIIFALLWGLACGYDHYLPYWYCTFFTGMIIHRAVRDNEKCAAKYGKDWDDYKKAVPYVIIPWII